MNTLLNSCLLNTLDRKGLENTELAILLRLNLLRFHKLFFAFCTIINILSILIYRWKIKAVRDIGRWPNAIRKWLLSKPEERERQTQFAEQIHTTGTNQQLQQNTFDRKVRIVMSLKKGVWGWLLIERPWSNWAEIAIQVLRCVPIRPHLGVNHKSHSFLDPSVFTTILCPNWSSPHPHPRSHSSTACSSSPSASCWGCPPSPSCSAHQTQPTRGWKLGTPRYWLITNVQQTAFQVM